MFDQNVSFPQASGPILTLQEVREQRVLTFSGVGADPSGVFGWGGVQARIDAFLTGTSVVARTLAGFCPAVVDGGWRDAVHAAQADFVVLEVANGLNREDLAAGLRKLRLFGLVTHAPQTMGRTTYLSIDEVPDWWDAGITTDAVQDFLAQDRFQQLEVDYIELLDERPGLVVHHAPLPVSRVILPMAQTFYFYACCSQGRFEALGDWYEMVAQLSAGLGVPVMPGDASPARAFAIGLPPLDDDAIVVPGALLNPADWRFGNGQHGGKTQQRGALQ